MPAFPRTLRWLRRDAAGALVVDAARARAAPRGVDRVGRARPRHRVRRLGRGPARGRFGRLPGRSAGRRPRDRDPRRPRRRGARRRRLASSSTRSPCASSCASSRRSATARHASSRPLRGADPRLRGASSRTCARAAGRAAATSSRPRSARRRRRCAWRKQIVRRSTELREDGFVAELELEKAKAEVELHTAGVERTRAARERGDWDRRVQTSELLAHLEESRHEESVVQREIAVADGRDRAPRERDRAAHDPRARRRPRRARRRTCASASSSRKAAPARRDRPRRRVSGSSPRSARGRARPRARRTDRALPPARLPVDPVRLDPRARHEPRERGARRQRARRALRRARRSTFPVPLQHGLPGRLEIEVERVSPATLVLRAVGRRCSTHGTARAGAASDAARTRRRRFLVPEVVQTSAMDCGPACAQVPARGLRHPRQLRAPARGLPDRRRRHVDRHARGGRRASSASTPSR